MKRNKNLFVLVIIFICVLVIFMSRSGRRRALELKASAERQIAGFRENKSLKEKIQTELNNGTIRDTFFLNFCFSDSLQSFNSKLVSLAKANEIRVDSGKKTIEYVFLADSVFKDFTVMLRPDFKNNKLSQLAFNFIPTIKDHLENRYTTVNQVIEKLENKYGPSGSADTTSEMAGRPIFRYYWIQGNVKIYLSGQKGDAGQPDMISVRYSDTREGNFE